MGDAHVEVVVEGLRATDQARMVAYPEAAATLESLRAAGLTVGVCSNWGWELDAYLEQVGLRHLVDAAVTSARAGSRKPHPRIYTTSARSLDVDPREVVFVGDSWEPDVRGPRRAGMTAVHVWRAEDRPGQSPPPLEPGDHRVEELTGVLGSSGSRSKTDRRCLHGGPLTGGLNGRSGATEEGQAPPGGDPPCPGGHGQRGPQTCRYYGISRQCFYKWLRRYEELGRGAP